MYDDFDNDLLAWIGVEQFHYNNYMYYHYFYTREELAHYINFMFVAILHKN